VYIPRVWAKASADGKIKDQKGQPLDLLAWGWGDDHETARRGAAERLQRLIERVRKGQPFPERYGYGNRPLREEILRTIDGETPEQPAAILTRNVYGAQVMNTARLLFLDVDLVDNAGLSKRLGRLFGRGPSPEEETLTRLREALKAYGLATFRIYRTASGYRVMAIDRDFNPTATDVQALMKSTGTDPAFSQLCQVQKSFRARLTPKPWRMDKQTPPGQHPREDAELRDRFAQWLSEYERDAAGYATCQYLETVGSGRISENARPLQLLHDQITRSDQSLPLA
jgi:hypothetical protein